jgi:GntR family transcriptional regulator, vanillate catabolism transcriptional regulator
MVVAARADSLNSLATQNRIGHVSQMTKSPPEVPTALVRQQIVVDRLREMIMTGELSGGDRLMEISLSEQLQVSRTPIREALIILAEDGLVEYRPNRGYIVRTFTLSYIMDAYVIREALEGVAARLAAEKGISDEMFAQMEALLDDGDRILREGGLKDELRAPLREINDSFHRFIVAAADNAVLGQALSNATNIPYSSSRVAHWYREEDPEGLFQLRTLHAQHHAILRAIRDGEGYRAETLMRGHIAGAADGIRKRLSPSINEDAAYAAAEQLRTVA